MNFNLLELQQHEAAWLAYGKRRASRLRWKKATHAEVAATLNVAALTQKIEAHDKRVWIARAWFRLFTSIERQREMLVYCLGRDVFSALIALPMQSTLVAQRVNLDKLAAVTTRASRFSWFKKPLNAFMGWVREKMGSAVVVSDHQPEAEPIVQDDHVEVVLPVVLDTSAALAAFYEKMDQGLRELALLYRQCSDKLHKYETSDEILANFDACFKPYKEKLRELQLYYHPDKVSHEKAVAAGLTDERFVKEIDRAFLQIQPQYAALEAKRTARRDANSRIVELDRKLIESKQELARAREQRIIAMEESAKLRAEVEAELKAAAERRKVRETRENSARKYTETYNRNCEQLAELKATLAAVEGAILAKKAASTNNVNVHESVSSTNPTLSTNPSTFFATNNSPDQPVVGAADKPSDRPVLH
jgi:hypothetical protein